MPFLFPDRTTPKVLSIDIADLEVGDFAEWQCQSRSSKVPGILSWIVEERHSADGCLLKARVKQNDTPALLEVGQLYGFRYMTSSPSPHRYKVTDKLLGSGYQWWFPVPAEPAPIECISEHMRTSRLVGGLVMSENGAIKIAA